MKYINDGDRLRGYSVEELILIAELLHNNLISPSDLSNIKQNFSLAYEIVRKDVERSMKASIENIWGGSAK